MNYKKIQKNIVGVFIGVIGLCLVAANGAQAATSKVVFDNVAGTLSVSGACSHRYVMVVIRRTVDNTIWGSSNPTCTDGAYEFDVDVPSADRAGGTFNVQVIEADSVGGLVPTLNGGANGASSQQVTFTPPPTPPVVPIVVTPASLIAIDTSSLATTPTDQSILDDVLSKFFGIVAAAQDAVQNISAIVADSVRTSLLASIHFFSKTITVLPGGSITIPRGANQMAGENWLNAGTLDVFIPNTSVASSSKILITPTSPTDVPLAVTQKSDGVGFHVGVPRASASPISFDWIIVATYEAAEPTSAQQGASALPTAPSQPSPVDSSPAPVVTPPPEATSSDATPSSSLPTPPAQAPTSTPTLTDSSSSTPAPDTTTP